MNSVVNVVIDNRRGCRWGLIGWEKRIEVE
jgi:hypothetical protein